MNLKLILKIIFTSIIFLIILVTLSLIINVILLGDLHHKHSFFRPDTDFRVNPGLLINSLFWGVLVSISYLFFGDKIRLKNGFLSGMLYGIVIYIFFIFSQELYYYLFIEFDFLLTFGSLVHYFLTFSLSCGFMGLILKK